MIACVIETAYPHKLESTALDYNVALTANRLAVEWLSFVHITSNPIFLAQKSRDTLQLSFRTVGQYV